MEEQNCVLRRDKEDTDAMRLIEAGSIRSATDNYLALGLGTGRDSASPESLVCDDSRPRPLTIVVLDLRGLLQELCHSLSRFTGRSFLIVCFTQLDRHLGNVRGGVVASARRLMHELCW